MSSQSVFIHLEYKALNSDRWDLVSLSPKDYFDLDPGESPSIDACPHHSHAIDYLLTSVLPIAATRLTLTEGTSQRQIVETFWNEGKNRLIERTDTGQVHYSETILEIQISQNPLTWEILRLERHAEMLVPLYHAFLQENPNGSQTETILLQTPPTQSPLPETA